VSHAGRLPRAGGRWCERQEQAMKILNLTRHGCALLLAGIVGQALAEEPLIVEPGQTQLGFSVPGLEALGEGDQLAVELDGYDVSALISRSEADFLLDLGSPLEQGNHPLLVMVFYADGNVATLLEAEVQVGAAAPAEAAGLEQGEAGAPMEGELVGPLPPSEEEAAQAAAPVAHRYTLYGLLSNSYRVDEKDAASYPDTPRYASSGGVSYRGEGSASDWQWQAELDALYDNLSENNPTGHEWELPNYRLAASRGSGLRHQGVALGNYGVLREDLLFSAYQRRGAVVTLGDALSGPLQLDVFGVQSEPLTDYNRRLGYPASGSERSSGGLLTFTPLQDDPQLLQLSAAYLNGETTDSGTAWLSTDQQTRYGGDSWNLAVDSRLGENSLWLHADYAWSSFDSDGLGRGEGDQDDTSHDLQAQFSSGQWFPAGPFDQWNLTLQRREVGLDFFTLGNLSLPGDLRMDRLNWQGYLGNLQLDAELGRETNNLDDQDEVADQIADRRVLNLYYYPTVDGEALPWRLLGLPSLNAGYSDTRRRQDEDDAQRVGFDLNDRTRESLFGASFYHARWNWSVQHTLQATDDHSSEVLQNDYLVYEPPSDQRNRFTTLQLGYMPLDSLSVSTSWQWNKLQETDDDNVYRGISRGLDVAWQIVPERWRLNASYYRGRDTSHFGDGDFLGDSVLQQSANLQLTWTVAQPDGLSPGLDWFLKGSYAQQDSRLYDQAQEDWQMLLGFDLRWDTHNY
jgi:hypothetical protein